MVNERKDELRLEKGESKEPEESTRLAKGLLELLQKKLFLLSVNSLLVELLDLKMEQRSGTDHEFPMSLKIEVQRYEKALIRQALYQTGGNQTKAADLLGVKPSTLNEKLKRYGLAKVGSR